MFIYELFSWLCVFFLIFVKKRFVSRKKEIIYKSEMSLLNVDFFVMWYNIILLILFIVFKLINYVILDEVKDMVYWFLIVDRLVYSFFIVLFDEYLLSVC